MKRLDAAWLERAYDRVVLPFLFVSLGLYEILNGIANGWLGIDGEIYLRGSAAWLAGGDPWATYSVIEGNQHLVLFHYSALPTMTVLLAPLTVIPESLGVMVLFVVCLASAVSIVRRLRMAWYWLMFPPLIDGVLSVNPSLPLLALLLSASPVLRGLASLLKVYAFIPLVGERDRKGIVAGAVLVVSTLIAWPLWSRYLGDFVPRTSRLLSEAGGGWSGAYAPLLMVIALIGLGILVALRDWRAVGWLAVPAVWPGTQFHYSTLAMPVMHPILAFGLAYPSPGAPVITITVYSIWRLWRRLAGRAYSVAATSGGIRSIPSGVKR